MTVEIQSLLEHATLGRLFSLLRPGVTVRRRDSDMIPGAVERRKVKYQAVGQKKVKRFGGETGLYDVREGPLR